MEGFLETANTVDHSKRFDYDCLFFGKYAYALKSFLHAFYSSGTKIYL